MTDPKPLVDVCETCGTDSCVPWEVHERLLRAFSELCKQTARLESNPAVTDLKIAERQLAQERKRTRRLTWWLAVASANWFIVLILWVVTR